MKFVYVYFCIILFYTPSLSQINLKNGLVACYPFNADAKDESGNNNNGTVNGATLTTDRFGKANSAYNFSGSNFIALPTDKFAFNEFSYAVWIYIASNPAYGDAYRILSIGGNCGDQDINTGNNYFNGGGGISGIGGGGYNISTPTTNSGVVAGTLPTIGKWYHGVITRDKNEIKLYVDGVLVRTVSTNGTLPYYGCDGKVFANIGTRSTQTQFFIGNIDDIHIYNRTLNAAEVKALYDGNTPQTITIATSNSAPCGGDKITFTANGATNTSKYQWKVDGLNQGINSKIFDYTSVKKTGDYAVKITVEVTDEDVCFPQKPATTDQTITIKDCTPPLTGVNLKNGLVACYPFNTNAKDESGNGNNGTVNGAILTTDRFGKANSAYNFNGGTDYIDIPSNKLQNPTFSYSAWIKPKSIPQSGIAFFILSVGSDSGDQGIGLNNGYTNGTDGFTGGGYLDIGENAFCQQGVFPNVNQWYHVVVIRSLDKYSVYVNGVFICSTSILTKPPFYGTGTAKATIGSRWNRGQFSDCVIDDIHLYNRPLTAAEVKALYDGNTPQTITIATSNSAPCGGDKITFTANGATNTSKYQWKVDGLNQGINSKTFDYTSVKKTGDYAVKITVEVSNDDSCFPQKPTVVDKTINLKFCTTPISNNNNVLIPNAFSPNGDGMNDTWEIFSISNNPDVIVEIYNRWGELIFYSKGYSEPWNGTYKDKPVLEGTYAYVVRINNDTVLRGTILVVR